MDGIHPHEAGPPFRTRLAAPADGRRGRLRARARDALALVGPGLAQVAGVAGRDAGQTLEAGVAEHLELAPHHRPRRLAADLPQRLVHLRQQHRVDRRAAPRERPRRRAATAILDPTRLRALPDQPRQLRPRQPRGLGQEPLRQPLVRPAQSPVVELHQHAPHEVVPRAPVRTDEVQTLAAFDEGAHLFQARKPLGGHCHDHPPMIPNPPPLGSLLVGIDLPL